MLFQKRHRSFHLACPSLVNIWSRAVDTDTTGPIILVRLPLQYRDNTPSIADWNRAIIPSDRPGYQKLPGDHASRKLKPEGEVEPAGGKWTTADCRVWRNGSSRNLPLTVSYIHTVTIHCNKVIDRDPCSDRIPYSKHGFGRVTLVSSPPSLRMWQFIALVYGSGSCRF